MSIQDDEDAAWLAYCAGPLRLECHPLWRKAGVTYAHSADFDEPEQLTIGDTIEFVDEGDTPLTGIVSGIEKTQYGYWYKLDVDYSA